MLYRKHRCLDSLVGALIYLKVNKGNLLYLRQQIIKNPLMVFHVKNTHTQKRILAKMMISLLILSTLLFFLVQVSPVSAQDGSANLTGIIYDEGVDTDGDGAYDYLNLGVEVNVTTAATYRLEAGGLYDSSYNSVSVLTDNSTYLDVGIHVVYLALNGTNIYASGVNPTWIAGINLYDESDTVLDTVYDLSLSKQYSYAEFQRPIIEIEFNKIDREIIIDQVGSIYVTNSYYITNMGFWTSTVEFGFPEDAYNFEVRDEMGTLEKITENGKMIVTLREIIDTNETETLYLNYHIPWKKYVSQKNGINYNLNFNFYEGFDSTIEELAVSITLPKGAEFQSSTPIDPISIKKSNLKETMNFAFSYVTPSEDLNFNINYKHLIFWSSFYPTIWIGILAIAASAVTFFWKAPKPSVSPIIAIPPKDLRSFVDYYEEKTRIRSELESLDERLRKGKIPRRRFKVRKKMLDGRLSTISRNLSTLSEKIRSAGSKYANMMRQIEVVETNLEGAERDMQRLESRYRRGEVSKDAYVKLLEEYKSRIEEAEATIDGVLLRLRE